MLLGSLIAPDAAPSGGACAPALRDPRAAEAVALAAGQHLVTQSLWAALHARGLSATISADLAEYLDAVHGLNARRNHRLRAQAGEIAAALNTAGLQPLFLKGMAVLLLDLHRDPATRFIGDIDILVARDRIDAAVAALRRHGYRQESTARPEHVHDMVKLTHTCRPARIELHQAPLALALQAIVPAAELLRRALPIDTPSGGRALVPCPTDLALHNVAHAMLHHHFYRMAELPLRDALDLVTLAARHGDQVDWDAVRAHLAIGPGGAGVLAFTTAAAATIFPGVPLPSLPLTTGARWALRRWRWRQGRPPGPLLQGLVHMLEHSRDVGWRLRHAPDERRRLLHRALAPRTYGHSLRTVLTVARQGPAPGAPGRTRTSERTGG